MNRTIASVAALMCGMSTGIVTAQAAHDGSRDYMTLSLEQLMKIEITSAAKRPVSVADTPAAVFVITNEDIRRSGARSIPELLRMVPGLNVAQTTASTWAISARGSNSQFANKLLVLIDGRSVYTPLFSGVFWDRQDTLLEDIDRIEVIRGPGASLWGANAVNGVINVITKDARETKGTYLSSGVGTNDEGRIAARYGDAIGEDDAYRVWGKAFNEGDRDDPAGTDGADDWRSARGGFRADFTDANGDDWQVQGGHYRTTVGGRADRPILTSPFSRTVDSDSTVNGTYALGSWTRQFGPENQLEVRSYVERTVGEDIRVDEERDTIDLDAQHSFTAGDRHHIVWGLGARYSRDDMQDNTDFAFDPDSDHQYQINGFVQDTIGFWNDTVELTVGSKFEYNNYTGFEVQPSVRGLLHVNDQHTVWAAVSRAVRTPSRAENDVDLLVSVVPPAPPLGLPTEVRFLGSESLVSEEMVALEAGHRWQVDPTLSFDLATFYNFYDRLLDVKADDVFLDTSGGVPRLVAPFTVNNDGEADVYGFELLGTWQARPDLRLQAWYAFLEQDVGGSNPDHQAAVRMLYDVTPTVSLDGFLRYVSELDSADVDGYGELALRLAWTPHPNVELAVIGQNLFNDEHLEFGADSFTGTRSTKVERSIYGSVTLRF